MKIFILFSLLLSGCASTPPLNFSPSSIVPAKHKIDAELKSIIVTLGKPDEIKGEIPEGHEFVTPLWKESLEDALNHFAVFKDTSIKKVSLSVKILAFNIPTWGGEKTTTAVANYKILDRETGVILYDKIIDSTGIVPSDFAFAGVVRGRESINRAVQNNISKFLATIENLNIS